jgi:hypothetical protein
MERAVYFSAIKSQEKIDADKGIIFGVSVITVGEAAGCNSGTWIDKTTLSQINEVAKTYPDGIKVKLSQSKEHDGSAGQIVGVLKNFRVDGDQTRADLHLLQASEKRAFVLEMAATMPSEFGLSVVIPKEFEKVGGKECLRCSEIYSVDLVEAPAANPTGLFSSKTPTTTMSIKYKSGDSGEHHAECECKECMSKHSKKEMSSFVAGLLGLSAEASETEISTAFKAIKTGDVAELSRKLDETKSELSRIQAASENSLALSKKGEIESMLAEASRAGKVVPFDNDDLFVEKDGKVNIKMEPVALSKVIAKLSAGTAKTSHTITLTAKTPEGKTVDRRTPEGREQFKTLLAAKREESANRYLATRN